MRSFSLISCFFALFALFAVSMVAAINANYWEMVNTQCQRNDQCASPCKDYASGRSATLKAYGCTKCSGWFNYYCQCYVNGEIQDSSYLDASTYQGVCRR